VVFPHRVRPVVAAADSAREAGSAPTASLAAD
jgi:hypothetical protein